MDIGPSFRGFWNIIVSLCYLLPFESFLIQVPLKCCCLIWHLSIWWRPKKNRFHPYLLCPDSNLNLLIPKVCPSDWCCPKTVHNSFRGSKFPPKIVQIVPTRQRNYMVLMMWMPLPYHLHLARTGWRILQNMARVFHPAVQFSNSAPDVWLKSLFEVCWRSIIQNFCRAILCIYGKMWDFVGINGPSFTVRCIVKYHFSIMPEGAPNKRIQVCYIGLASL